MPLHDWSQLSGWEGMHLLWISELLRYLKSRLPEGYRAYLGSGPAVAIGAPSLKPDVAIRAHEPARQEVGSHSLPAAPEPDLELAVASLDPAPALFVELENRLVSAVELVSPRNKDRPVARSTYLSRYAGYLIEGVHLLLVDLHRQPLGFSFAAAIAQELQMDANPTLPPPLAVSYRVGEPAGGGGRLLAIWRRPLTIGQNLPEIPLPLRPDLAIPIDLEQSYMAAAADAYLV